ncbi:uncharacterized protein BHQ10_006261 [Talaromyces amestolkiae]|uniref:DUF952 domain-containing protein n=1 Tax=Talaromyces amestolkiae TaxID=1196081 RepID=A0A364L364_TALAM|nr:uncharacterized protein BHQ10_006261 [Talaromyces amestolkiae]RAO70249.1 hypothetical protein BHQ10_006261 [Talaromyces amestolkiae]
MASSDALKYVYKLVPSSAPIPESLPDRLPVSDLDLQSGFIHLSSARQVPNTLKFFFKDEPVLYVLRLEYAMVEDNIRWESPDAKICGPRDGEGMFPHLYNGLKLGKDEIESVATWKNENGWDNALEEAASWLI